MKYLGIDYGAKRIGLALSDDRGKIAFPHAIISTADKDHEIAKIISSQAIGAVVIGKSLDLKGQSNKIQEEIESFAAILGMQYGLPVHFVNEFMTSSESRHMVKNERGRSKPVANPRRSGKPARDVDAKAAALILQRHLDAIQLKSNG